MAMKREDALFWTFLIIFIATAVVTLLGLVGSLDVQDKYLAALVPALLIELAGSVILYYRQTFTPSAVSPASGPPAAVQRITGSWWELITSHPTVAVSFVLISYAADSAGLELSGSAYARDGARSATWDSDAACFSASDLAVFYVWRGDEISREDGTAYAGYGSFRFAKGGNDANPISEGRGWYSEGDGLEATGQTHHVHELRRANPQEIATMTGDDMEAREQLVRTVNETWRAHLSAESRRTRVSEV